MPAYLHPGVYVEEVPGGSRPIEAVATSTAVFLGYTPKGPLDVPTRLSKWDDYERVFGGLTPAKDVSAKGTTEHQDMGLALQAFFLNGGGATFIVRLAKKNTAKKATGDSKVAAAEAAAVAAAAAPAAAETRETTETPATPAATETPATPTVTETPATPAATPATPAATPAPATARLVVEAIDEGEWGNELRVKLKRLDRGMARLMVERRAGTAWEEVERFDGVWAATDPNCFQYRVNIESKTIRATTFTEGTLPQVLTDGMPLGGGSDGNAPDDQDYDAAFTGLEKNREISIVCLPGQAWEGSGKTIVEKAVAHADKVKRRVVLVDPPKTTELLDGNAVDDLLLPTSNYTMLYYPWVKVANPAYDPEQNPGVPPTLLVAPSAFAAGMYAKIDGRRGVWKAPAGVETQLLGVAKLEYLVNDSEQDVLNPLGINCLRTMPGYGNVIWGARTLATKADPPWRYVPVRRTAIMIEQSIYNAIQWAVFEPNDEPLWSALRTSVGGFMNGLFRSGAFQGGTANDAYFVRCGLGDTMTQDDVDLGQVIVVVGFAPLKPAEFVIVRIQQKVAKQ